MISAPTVLISSSSGIDQSSWTPSGGPYNLVAGRVYYAALRVEDSDGTPPTPTATLVTAGTALTAIANVALGNYRLIVFRFTVPSNTSDEVTFSFGDTCTEADAIICEVEDAEFTGTNGADSIVQFKTGTTIAGTSVTCTFDNPLTAGNAVLYWAFRSSSSITPNPDTGWTEFADSGGGTMGAYRLNHDDNSPSTAVGSSANYAILAIEVVSAETGQTLEPNAVATGEVVQEPASVNLKSFPDTIAGDEAVFEPTIGLYLKPGTTPTSAAVYNPVTQGSTWAIDVGELLSTSQVFEPTTTPGAVTILPTTIPTNLFIYTPIIQGTPSPVFGLVPNVTSVLVRPPRPGRSDLQ